MMVLTHFSLLLLTTKCPRNNSTDNGKSILKVGKKDGLGILILKEQRKYLVPWVLLLFPKYVGLVTGEFYNLKPSTGIKINK